MQVSSCFNNTHNLVEEEPSWDHDLDELYFGSDELYSVSHDVQSGSDDDVLLESRYPHLFNSFLSEPRTDRNTVLHRGSCSYTTDHHVTSRHVTANMELSDLESHFKFQNHNGSDHQIMLPTLRHMGRGYYSKQRPDTLHPSCLMAVDNHGNHPYKLCNYSNGTYNSPSKNKEGEKKGKKVRKAVRNLISTLKSGLNKRANVNDVSLQVWQF